jgi:hypothetical protein
MAEYKVLSHTAAQVDQSIEQIANHVVDSSSHVTSEERESWNAKPDSDTVYDKSEVDVFLGDKQQYSYGVEIVASTSGEKDLNDYTLTGTYNSNAASAANTLNTPRSPNGAITGYRMDVLQISATLVSQIVRTNGADCYIFVRNKTTSGWTPWYNLNTWGLAQGIAQNTDLNDYTAVGAYYCGAATSATLTNNPHPSGAIKLYVEYLNAANRFIQKIVPAETGAFQIFYRQYTNVGWGAWYLFSGTEVQTSSTNAINSETE